MYNKGIISPLKTFIPKVSCRDWSIHTCSTYAIKISSTLSQYLDSPQNAPENAQKLVYEFADNVITIFWCLS